MAVNRLRQKYGQGVAVVKNTIDYVGGYPPSQSWSVTRSDLGETKSIYDEASIQTFQTRKGLMRSRWVTDRNRSPANFKPVRIASIIKGNGVFDGYLEMDYSLPYYNMARVVHKGPVLALGSFDQGSVPIIPSATAFPNLDTATSNWCLQQAANEASEPVHEFGVTLGELAETVSMLISPLQAVSKLAKRLGLNGGVFMKEKSRYGTNLVFRPHINTRKGAMNSLFGKPHPVKSGCYVVNQASDFWLTWRFGVKPLIKEINDIMTMDYSSFEDSPLRISRKRSTKPWVAGVGPSIALPIGNYFYVLFRDSYRHRTMSQASYAYALKHGTGFSDFLNANGLALRHLPQIMWELVPCSFVLDRFLDIGSFIRSITPDPSVTTLGTCVSTKFEYMITREYSAMSYSYSTFSVQPKKNHRFRLWNTTYTRDVGVPVPIKPLFNPKLLKIEQLIDHATLVWQRLPKWR